MRKLAGTLLAAAIAVVGVIALIAFFDSRDSSTTSGDGSTTAAGRPAPGSAGGALLAGGNIVLRYSDDAFGRRLRALARELGGPDTPELRRAGQAVVLRRDRRTGGVVAVAYGHTLAVAVPSDPTLRAFVERWLGQGASG
jgi:hypothetical protein